MDRRSITRNPHSTLGARLPSSLPLFPSYFFIYSCFLTRKIHVPSGSRNSGNVRMQTRRIRPAARTDSSDSFSLMKESSVRFFVINPPRARQPRQWNSRYRYTRGPLSSQTRALFFPLAIIPSHSFLLRFASLSVSLVPLQTPQIAVAPSARPRRRK